MQAADGPAGPEAPPRHRRWAGAALLLGIGALLRLHQFALGRSLYVDEAALALNLLDRSYLTLWDPLDYEQAAPIGFLLLEKLITQQLGDSEYALRLLPLLAGLVSLLLFHRLAERSLSRFGARVALAAFALSAGLIYFGSDLKPYALDVAVALAVYLATWRVLERDLHGGLWALGAVGVGAVWLSFPALFVLAGIGLPLGIEAIRSGERATVWRLAAVGAAWTVSFAVMYFATLHQSGTVGDMQFFWERDGHFMPLPPGSAGELRWFYASFFELFRNPTGLPLTGVAALAFLIGAVSLWGRNRMRLALLLGPLLFTLFASGLHLYPFHGRVLLFLTPGLLLLIGEGVSALQTTARPAVPALLAGLLLFHPAMAAVNHLVKSQEYEAMPLRDLRGVLEALRSDPAATAPVYVYYGADRVFEYYGPRLGFAPEQVHWGSSPGRRGTYAVDGLRELFLGDLKRLRDYEQLWLVVTNARRTEGLDEAAYLLSLVEGELNAERIRTLRTKGAAAYLYRRAGPTVTRQ